MVPTRLAEIRERVTDEKLIRTCVARLSKSDTNVSVGSGGNQRGGVKKDVGSSEKGFVDGPTLKCRIEGALARVGVGEDELASRITEKDEATLVTEWNANLRSIDRVRVVNEGATYDANDKTTYIEWQIMQAISQTEQLTAKYSVQRVG